MVEDIRKMIYQCCIDAVAHVFDANKGIRGITTRLLAQSMPIHVGYFPGHSPTLDIPYLISHCTALYSNTLSAGSREQLINIITST
eukprot:g35647.t1